MVIQKTLDAALKLVEPIIREYIRQLKAEITKLHKEVAKLEIEKMKFKNQNVTYKQRVSTLQKDLDKAKSVEPINIILQRPEPPSAVEK